MRNNVNFNMNCAYAVFQKIYFEASQRPGKAWKYPPTDANAATSRTHGQPTFKALISPFVVLNHLQDDQKVFNDHPHFRGKLHNLQQLVEELQLSTLPWQISVDSIAKSPSGECVYHSLIPKPRLISRSVIYSSPNLALKFWTSPVETWFLELAINWCPFQAFSSHKVYS